MSDIKISRTQKALRLIQDEGITAKEAAERVGITNAAVSKGKCHPSKTQQKIRMLSEMQKEIESLRQQLAEKDAEIVNLKAYYEQVMQDGGNQIKKLNQQLAISQAREQQLREALNQGYGWAPIGSTSKQIMGLALALPTDTTALSAMINKAGEVMRERCESTLEKIGAYDNCYGGAHAIRALPGVTLEDLK